ncbi:hypothetical protein AM571_PA00065 (plasmid) [Rhizobium etli 8C-3]|uniref:Uncharacterized protein n=1 Tax=Rhizobium etli 8C-3 TaxID=538025 RepID=A0A1L5PA48_RHIET|nr:hypothetical protein [Rhizobium etli]APO76953.1 hypothetical protein AM571_PA00065 [Rhizobium etli 8C-3]
MKTPQRKFVVEFKSGRRAMKARTNSIWGDTDLKAFARETEDSAPHPFNSDGAPGTPDEGGDGPSNPMNSGSASEHAGEANVAGTATPSGNGADGEVPNQHEASVLAVEIVAQMPESQPEPQPRTTSKRTPRNRVRRGPIAMGRNKPRSAESVTARDSVSLEEVAALGAENKRLKTLLAEQLHLQNLQLKKMLERFDVT